MLVSFSTLSTDNLPCHFVSAFGAGFVTTVIASPVDVVKTRYMNSPPGQYKSAINCAWTMLTKEGPTAFYKGWAPSSLTPEHADLFGNDLFLTSLDGNDSAMLHFFTADLCPHSWGWDHGTLWCLSHSNKSREPWWSLRRRWITQTEIAMPVFDWKTWTTSGSERR